MAEYIERNAAVSIADYAADVHPYEKSADKPETFSEYNQGWNDACDYIREKLEEEPPADVAPVRHGRWELVTTKYSAQYARVGYCQNCNEERLVDNYCPNCGAKMDGEAKL